MKAKQNLKRRRKRALSPEEQARLEERMRPETRKRLGGSTVPKVIA